MKGVAYLKAMLRFSPRELEGWGRFPRQSCRVARPEKRRALSELAQSSEVQSVLARGLGRAYGDAALNEGEGILLGEKLDRFLDFDSQDGLLHLESGTSFAQILETFVPRGWFLPVVPGTKFVTVGGALASDVHGKNHHRMGTISNFVEEFELLLASGETLVCSKTQNPDAFRATLGGMGLTGVVTSAKLKLRRIETAQIQVRTERTMNLDQTLDGFGRDSDTTYSVAWIDCLASGDNLGRSVLIRGEHASLRDLDDADFEDDPLDYPSPKAKKVPRDLPDFALNPMSVKAFNAFYYSRHIDGAQLQGFEPFFWPLDAVGGWNKIYGARGFVQYHCILPFQTSHEGLTRLLERISSSGRAAFLAVLKLYGPENDSPLSFPLAGHSLALDLPASDGIIDFCRELDRITVEHGGRTYLAKDSTLDASTFAQMYPRLPEFEAIKRQLDPQNRFQSSLSRRLNIAGMGGTR
ncbi:decaprenylphosphoryl-beta-D-ribose oxidase [Abditibacteriota bacterium]|nr:decaprenylphosphoryl-beta-D-ribose oxidase [Abditibacteriota bacterium]